MSFLDDPNFSLSRHNTFPPNATQQRVGDWTSNTVRLKYSSSDSQEGPSSLPFGFGDRQNTKSLEELSRSSSASAVAVAEVCIGGVNKIESNGGGGGGGESLVQNTLPPLPDPLLANAMLQLDGRVRVLEASFSSSSSSSSNAQLQQSMAILLLQQQQILAALERIEKAKT